MIEFADAQPSVHSESEEIPRSANYGYARSIIEEGIAKSQTEGYAEVKVECFVKNDNDPDGGKVHTMSLAEFFGSNALYKMVPINEFNDLLGEFNDALPHNRGQQTRGLGSTATRVAVPHIVSRDHEWVDIKSRIANDDTLDD